MILSPRPRFHLIKWSQFVACIMLASGILPYVREPDVPATIYWRIGAIGAIFLLMFALPDIPNIGPAIISGIAGERDNGEERLADKPKIVRNMIWWYCLIDLALLTYLVHITGGITGSMYAGSYLLIPSLALLLLLGSADIARAFWLIVWTAAGLALSFWFSHFGKIEYDAAKAHHAFDIALTVVSIEGISLLILQVLVLKIQFEKAERDAAAQSARGDVRRGE